MDASKTFPATLNQLQKMLQWIRTQLFSAGLEKEAVFKAEIASEEALVNIIQHAYKNVSGKIQIDIHEGKKIKPYISITIRDHGPAFDPLQRDVAFDLMAPLEQRPIGGLGILFMRKYMDEVHYKREQGVNILTLVKNKQS